MSLRAETAECLETAGVIVGIKDVAEISTELIVSVIVIPCQGRVLDCAFHPLDLPICRSMVWLG